MVPGSTVAASGTNPGSGASAGAIGPVGPSNAGAGGAPGVGLGVTAAGTGMLGEAPGTGRRRREGGHSSGMLMISPALSVAQPFFAVRLWGLTALSSVHHAERAGSAPIFLAIACG